MVLTRKGVISPIGRFADHSPHDWENSDINIFRPRMASCTSCSAAAAHQRHTRLEASEAIENDYDDDDGAEDNGKSDGDA